MTDIVIYSAGSSPFLRQEYLSTETSASVSRPTSDDIQATSTRPFQRFSPSNSSATFYYEHNDQNSSSPSFIFHPINSNSIPMKNNANRTVPVEILPRRLSNSDQHYDYPSNIIEQRRIPTIVPFNSLKRMDRLNTIFVKPTRIERPLPKLVFQENESEVDVETQTEEEEEKKSYESSSQQEYEQVRSDSRQLSPIFFEQPGLTKIDETEEERQGKRVKFSTKPIRVYPTYSPSEYDRRNEDIDPFSASAEYELEKRIEKMHVFEVQIEKGAEGLGMSVLGMGVGADSGLEKLGIFVKALNPQGLIARDGRIAVGDQIIEVNDNYMVGVTHQFATNILKTTTGLIRFLIGREKDAENSEVLRLIHRSLQMDHERDETSQTTGTPTHDDVSLKSAMTNEYEMEILKECFESLEKTLETTEKERDHFHQLYQQTFNDFQQLEDKYRQANELIGEFQQRENQWKVEQNERQEQQRKYIGELIKKINDLEEKITQVTDTSTMSEVIESNGFRQSSRSRRPDQNENLWQKRSGQSKSMDRIELKNLQSSSKSISDHVGTQDSIETSMLILNASPVGDAGKSMNDSSLIDEYVEVKDWSSDLCVQWLTNENLTEFIPFFLNRNIDGEKLLSLDGTKMKAIGIKSSKDRERLKQKLKELKHTDLDQIREKFLTEQIPTTTTTTSKSNRFRSSSLNKLRDRRLFSMNSSK